MSTREKLIKARLGLLALAEEQSFLRNYLTRLLMLLNSLPISVAAEPTGGVTLAPPQLHPPLWLPPWSVTPIFKSISLPLNHFPDPCSVSRPLLCHK